MYVLPAVPRFYSEEPLSLSFPFQYSRRVHHALFQFRFSAPAKIIFEWTSSRKNHHVKPLNLYVCCYLDVFQFLQFGFKFDFVSLKYFLQKNISWSRQNFDKIKFSNLKVNFTFSFSSDEILLWRFSICVFASVRSLSVLSFCCCRSSSCWRKTSYNWFISSSGLFNVSFNSFVFSTWRKIFDLSRIEDKCYIAIMKFTFLVLLYRAVVSWEAILDEPNFKAFWLVLPPSLPPPPDPDPVPFGFSALSFNWWRNILAHYKLKKHLSEAIFLISCNVPEEKQQVPWSRHRQTHLIHSVKKIKSKNIATVTRAIFLGTNRSTESRIPFVHV